MGQVRRRKEAGNTLRATMLKGLYFVFPVELQRFGSGGSRFLGWIVGKISLFSLYPTPVHLLGFRGLKNLLLHLSDLHRKCQGLKLDLSHIEKGDNALSSGCGSTKHSALCYDVTGLK